MTKEQVIKLVSYWQYILKLDHWEIRVRMVDKISSNPDAAASCSADFEYLNATIDLVLNDPENKKHYNKKELTRLIIHELLHCHLSGLNIIYKTPESLAEEQAIQILSRVIYEGYK